jgi:hypothetical protein
VGTLLPPLTGIHRAVSSSEKPLVPDDEAGDSLQPRDGRADERREGVMIASARSFDEFPLVHSHPS